MDVTREEFESYENVRRSGKVNMLMDSNLGAALSGLSTARYMAVLRSYGDCLEKWPDVVAKPHA